MVFCVVWVVEGARVGLMAAPAGAEYSTCYIQLQSVQEQLHGILMATCDVLL